MADHRAPRRARPRSAGPGRRRATVPVRTPLRLIPNVPVLVGVGALVLATAGAVTVHHPAESHAPALHMAQASVLGGTDAVRTLDDRAAVVSRDSERQALADAADDQLQAAAEQQARQRNAALAELASSAEKYASKIAAHAWVLPVDKSRYHLTARFGYTSGLWVSTHTGLDFAAVEGTPVHAVAAGKVTETGYAGAYGNRIIVTLNDGTEAWFCHLSAYAVRVGDRVRPGEAIGAVGSTGNTTGPHLHLEIRPGAGDPVDPFTALEYHGLHP